MRHIPPSHGPRVPRRGFRQLQGPAPVPAAWPASSIFRWDPLKWRRLPCRFPLKHDETNGSLKEKPTHKTGTHTHMCVCVYTYIYIYIYVYICVILEGPLFRSCLLARGQEARPFQEEMIVYLRLEASAPISQVPGASELLSGNEMG